MANQWLRLWHDMPNDPKWRTIARLSQQRIGDVISVYLHVIVNASNATERGRTQNLCAEDIASALDLDVTQIEQILSAMQGRVLENDKVSGWEKRQPLREDGAAGRAKAWRDAKKAEIERTEEDTERNRTQPNAEKRSDKDTDKDKEKKKDSAIAPPPFDPASIPNLNLEAWNLWVEHRSKIKKPIKPHSLPDAAEALAKLGDAQLAEVKRARAAGWQGIHPEKTTTGRYSHPEPSRARAFPTS